MVEISYGIIFFIYFAMSARGACLSNPKNVGYPTVAAIFAFLELSAAFYTALDFIGGS